MKIALPENVKGIIKTLEKSGFKAYIVGGCVRDSLLGKSPSDFDICTNATPREIMSLFEKTVPTGIEHGTVTVVSGKCPIEVTTFRTDGKYKDFRRPENVHFVSELKEDLSRRDFTVNAMCYSDSEGLIDPFDGKADLERKILRTVGEPEARFNEDALRILRLFRFSSTLGFDIQKRTLNAATNNAALLKNVSAERILAELKKLVSGNNPEAVLPLLKTGALELFSQNNQISKIPLLRSSESLRLFAFLRLSCKSLSDAVTFLKCSNVFKNYVVKLNQCINKPFSTRPEIKKLLSVLEEDVFDLFSYKSVMLGEDMRQSYDIAKEVLCRGEPYKISQLCVDGRDIAKAGYKGKQIGEKLDILLEKVTENPELNSKEQLLNLI